MDDISREPRPDHPGQRVDPSGVRRKDPAEWGRLEESLEIDGGSDRFTEEPGAGSLDGVTPGERLSVQDSSSDSPGFQDDPESADATPGDEPTPARARGPADEDAPVEDTPAAGVAGGDPDAVDEDDALEPPQAPEEDQLGRVLGALLLSSRESLTLLRLAQATNTSPREVKAALQGLSESLEAAGLALEVSITGERVRLLTTPDVFDYVRNLRAVKKRERLSPAALETLAVVAYRQPVMRAEIEAIRGVKAGPILRTLLDHRMVKMVGRADVPGRPLQYGTTQHFLDTFGLESLSDLPSVKEFRQL